MLHGRTVRYGTAANSSRAFATLDQLHSQCETAARLGAGERRKLEQRRILLANQIVTDLVPNDVRRVVYAARLRSLPPK